MRFQTLRYCIGIATKLMATLSQSWLLHCVARFAQASLASRTFEITKLRGAVMMIMRQGHAHRQLMPNLHLRSHTRLLPQRQRHLVSRAATRIE